jgi:hypothetical protein
MTRHLLTPLLALTALAACATTSAPDMKVEEFLTIHERTMMNSAAHLQSDTQRMIRASDYAIAAVRAEQAEARRAGRRPPNCLRETQGVSPMDVAEALKALPAEQRRTATVREALMDWAGKTYPCFG